LFDNPITGLATDAAKVPAVSFSLLGGPLPGQDFVDAAVAMGDSPPTFSGSGKAKQLVECGPILTELYRQATYEPRFQLSVMLRGHQKQAVFVPGHIWGRPGWGPAPAEIMIVGKWPGKDDLPTARNFCGEVGNVLVRALVDLGVPEELYEQWYVTNVSKYPNIDPQSDRLSAAQKNCAPIFYHELKTVRPKYILCLGSDAAQAVIGPAAKGGVAAAQGRVFEVPLPGCDATASAVVCMNPGAVVRDESQYKDFTAGLGKFVELVRTGKLVDRVPLQVVRLYTEEHLRSVVDELLVHPEGHTLAVDCEWNGDFPTEPNAWLRTLQFTHRGDVAYIVVFRHAGGAPAFVGGPEAAARQLRRLFLDTPSRKVRLIGHNLRADLPWIIHLDRELGEGMAEQFTAPDDDPGVEDGPGRWGWEKTRDEGGFDTMIAVHSVQEVAGPFGFKLEVVTGRFCGVPWWDVELRKWKKQYCSEHKIKAVELEGYGDCPDDVLLGDVAGDPAGCVSYAGWDVAGTMRLFHVLNRPGGHLDKDAFGNCSRKPFWTAMRASPAFLEMERTGFRFDADVARSLTSSYQAATARLLLELRTMINWPEFNPASVYQVRDLLFGPEFTGKRDASGNVKRFSPETVSSLRLRPITTTGKPPKSWEDVARRGEENLYSPSTAKETLSIFRMNMPKVTDFDKYAWGVVDRLRSIRFLSRLLSSVLSPDTATDKEDDDSDDEGEEFTRGLPSSVHADGVIRTHVFPTQETGRAATVRPPLQNLCLSADTDYLTLRGWVNVSQLKPDDKVAQYDERTKQVTFVQPTEIHVSRYDGEMVRLRSRQTDVLVTPNHRMLLRDGDSCIEVEADNFAAARTPTRVIPAAGLNVGEDWSRDQIDYIALVTRLALFSNSGRNRSVIGRRLIFGLRDHQIEEAHALLKRMGGNPHRGHWFGLHRLTLNSRNSPELFAWTKAFLGARVALGPWLFSLSHRTLRRFLIRYHWWARSKRPSRRRPTVFQARRGYPDGREWLQAAAALSGRWSCNPKPKPGSRPKGLRLLHRVHSDTVPSEEVRVTRKPYAGDVYCVTVPTGWIVVRRNGRTAIVGNSKKREKDYSAMLGADYKYPIRAMLAALPGYVLVEADYIGAELFMMAVQCGSAKMADHCRRSELPDSDPNKYDIHSSIAVLAFQLTVPSEAVIESAAKLMGKQRSELTVNVGDPLPANKTWLKAIGRSELRDAVKALVFGIPYGRGDDAVIRAVEEVGVKLSLEDAAKIRAAIFSTYPELEPFLAQAQARSVDPMWLANWNGRFRRFYPTTDRGVAGEMARQAGNFSIQSGVADAVNVALDYLYRWPGRVDRKGYRFLFCLQIHDAIMFHVRTDCVEWFLGTDKEPGVLQRCMSGVRIRQATLSGVPVPGAPEYHMPVEYAISLNWGIPIKREEGLALGIPETYLPKAK